jgi:hypothetical protein
LQYYSFVVDETPYCIWGWDLAEENQRFLEGIDAGYFAYLADAHGAALDGDHRHHAALALRAAYSQALETFFALLGAAIQAPQCPIGWILKYQIGELRSLVRKLRSGGRIYSRIAGPITWESLTSVILTPNLDDASAQTIRRNYARLWRRFSLEFLDAAAHDEYNSIKHGLRARPGGFMLSVGLSDEPGVPPPDERMSPPSGSTFGTSFFEVEKVGADRRNLQLCHTSLNWHPENLISGLELLSASIKNVLTHLQIQAGKPGSEFEFVSPEDEDSFEAPWRVSISYTRIRQNPSVRPEHIKPQSKDEILAAYGSETGTDPQPEPGG